MDKVAVLMSTYNGERFLEEQIDSIFAQKDVEITLYIRDDGSKDRTIDIINTYLDDHSNIIFVNGRNVGVGNSFMSIMKQAGVSADYYAFADQDDIWLPEKLNAAIAKLKIKNGPRCYCSNQMLVDSEGCMIRKRHTEPINTDYMQVLCNNLVTGCTMVWNRKLQEILIDPERFPSEQLLKKRIHDVWVAMVAAVVGEVIYDENGYIYYRQHENNVVGVKQKSIISEWKKKINDPALRNGRSSLAKEIFFKYKDLIVDQEMKDRLLYCGFYNTDRRYRRLLLEDRSITGYSGESYPMLALKIMSGLF